MGDCVLNDERLDTVGIGERHAKADRACKRWKIVDPRGAREGRAPRVLVDRGEDVNRAARDQVLGSLRVGLHVGAAM